MRIDSRQWFAAPLDENGHLLADEWRSVRERCRVKRFWPGQKSEIGQLVHRRGGSWAFDYDAKRTDDDEPALKFERHHFIPGEYVSITEHDGVMRTFRVIWVRDLWFASRAISTQLLKVAPSSH